MATISLLQKTENTTVDALLARVIALFEARFPSRVRAYYLLGSYGDRKAVAGSDIDLSILFKDAGLKPDEKVPAQHIISTCEEMSVQRLEIKIGSEQTLYQEHNIVRVALKLNSLLLYGEDTRAMMPLPSRDDYIRDATEGVLEFILRLHALPDITYPLVYPDPQGIFFGYDTPQWLLPDSKQPQRGTRLLVECALRMSTALIALNTTGFVGTKRESAHMYNTLINDAWSPFLLAIFERCKMAWHYELPENKAEQAELRTLCTQMLPFENHYLIHYRLYLLTSLQSPDPHKKQAARNQLETVHFEDDEIKATSETS